MRDPASAPCPAPTRDCRCAGELPCAARAARRSPAGSRKSRCSARRRQAGVLRGWRRRGVRCATACGRSRASRSSSPSTTARAASTRTRGAAGNCRSHRWGRTENIRGSCTPPVAPNGGSGRRSTATTPWPNRGHGRSSIWAEASRAGRAVRAPRSGSRFPAAPQPVSTDCRRDLPDRDRRLDAVLREQR